MRDRNRRPASPAQQPVDAAESEPTTPSPEPQAEGDGGGDSAPAEVPERSSSVSADSSRPDTSQQLSEQQDRYLRLAAEYDNFRKRTAKERAEAGARGQAELVTRLLDGLDDLQRFAHVDPASTDSLTLHKGIEMVEQKVLKALAGTGLEVINPLDQTFDPTLHEAVTTEPALSPEDDHTVARVFQPGYRFNGQLLRPARVVVKQWRG